MRALLALMLVPSTALAADYGVPQSGYPSWQERTELVYVNRARADPATDLQGCASSACAEWQCYAPSPPMVWDYDLNRSARFHSSNLSKTSSPLQHDSPCVLVTNIGQLFPPDGTCDGSASCACQPNTLFNCAPSSAPNGTQPTCTSPWERMADFSASGQAENAAYGYDDPKSTFYQWLWESDGDPSCGWRSTNGHRANILGGSSAVGTGYDESHWTQDFGGGSIVQPLVAGSHEPQQGGGAVEFRANWYASSAPSDAEVDVDGSCAPMAVERGDGGNATYLATVSLDASCHRYLFVFKDASGQAVVLPEQGSYGAGDPASCADWDASAPVLCGGATTSSTSTSTGGTSGTTSTSGGGTSGTSTGGATATSTATSSAGSTSGGAAPAGPSKPGASAVGGGCESAGGLELWALLALAGLLRRRR